MFTELVSFHVPGCSGFDSIVVDASGPNSCQKLVRADTTYGSVSAGFSWEEAQMQCERWQNSTLALPTRYELSANTTNNGDDNDPTLQATWFGVRRSGALSNTSCRLVASTNQCADPIHGFRSDTNFLDGVYVCSSGNGQDSLTLRLPETRLSQAMCQVNFKPAPPAEASVTYHLKLAWKNSTGTTLKLYLTREGSLGNDWDKIPKQEWQFVRLGLVCFGDGILYDVPITVANSQVMELEFPAYVVGFFCESRTSTAMFLRSNTILWRGAGLTFVVTVRDRLVRIVPDILSLETRQAHARVAPSGPVRKATVMADVSQIAKSQFAEQYEPSKISNKKLRQSGFVDVELGNDSSPLGMRKYSVLNAKYDRVVVDSENYEELLVRYHVVLNSATESLPSATKQLQDDMQTLMDKMDRPYSELELRSMATCLEEVEGSLTWIETPLDRTTLSREGCVFDGGSLVQRTCIGDIYYGAHWGPTQAWNADGQLVHLTNNFTCASPSETTSRLLNLIENQQNATSTLAELQTITSQWNPIIADVQQAALIFSNASREETVFSQTSVHQTSKITEQVLSVDTDTLAKAQRLPNVTTNLLMGIEHILTNSSKSTLTSRTLRGSTAKLEGSTPYWFIAKSTNLGELNDTVVSAEITRSTSTVVSDHHHHDALVILNGSSLMLNRASESQIAFVYHRNIRLADAAVAAGESHASIYSPISSDGDHEMIQTAKFKANSAMVQVSIKGEPVYSVSEQVNIYLRPFPAVNTSNSTENVVCAFWSSEVNNGHGGWSTRGCSYLGRVSGLDHCQCNHLSIFTTLMNYYQDKDELNEPILDILTKIGCVLSIVGCIGVVATYALFPKWRKPKPGYHSHHVIFHLSLALAMLLATFLGGFDQTTNEDVCLFVASFLHYLMLAVFFWMLVEAYCHYSLFLRILSPITTNFMLKAFLFAWVLPLVPVIALVVFKKEFYHYKGKDNKFCWLKPEGFQYALLPFASFIGLINLALYILIVVKIGCTKSMIRSTQTKLSFTPYTAVVMFFVMGLSWIFGMLAFGQARTVFSYLFCIFCPLQGFAIFFHFILRGARAQEEWQNFIERKSDRDRTVDEAELRTPSAVPSCCAPSSTSLSNSTCTVHSLIIVEFQNRQRQRNASHYETCV